jgi:DNA-binding winged helix-turn-helix (wHTH) protein
MDDRRILAFGAFRLDIADERLWHGDTAVPLTTKAFAVFRYLVEHAGQLVRRDTLLEAVWDIPYVSDAALASCIRGIRRALDDPARAPQPLETIRRRGYRFLAPVTDVPSPRTSQAPVAPPHDITPLGPQPPALSLPLIAWTSILPHGVAGELACHSTVTHRECGKTCVRLLSSTVFTN